MRREEILREIRNIIEELESEGLELTYDDSSLSGKDKYTYKRHLKRLNRLLQEASKEGLLEEIFNDDTKQPHNAGLDLEETDSPHMRINEYEEKTVIAVESQQTTVTHDELSVTIEAPKGKREVAVTHPIERISVNRKNGITTVSVFPPEQ